MIEITYFTDPACPFAYSASPALAALRWRYGDQLRWRVVTVGLLDGVADLDRIASVGFTPKKLVHNYMWLRERWGMPFSTTPRARLWESARACRAIVAARLLAPAFEYQVLRALQFGNFADGIALDDDAALLATLSVIEGLDAHAVVGALDSVEVTAAYLSDRDEARSAAGGAADFQGRTVRGAHGSMPAAIERNLKSGEVKPSDEPFEVAARYATPSLILESNGLRFEVGGLQHIDAYDLAIANLDSTLERERPAKSVIAAVTQFPGGLTTQEVAVVMARDLDLPDRTAAERALSDLAWEGAITRKALAGDALWRLA